MSSIRPGTSGNVATAEEVREANVADAAAIEAVHFASREAAYGPHVSEWPPEGPGRAQLIIRWEHWLSDPGIHCLVAERGSEIIGFVTVRAATDSDIPPGHVAEMPTLYVHPEHWRSGVGRVLCRAGIERARNLGFDALVLWVLEINARARAFYAALGFLPDGVSKIDEGTPEAFTADRYRLDLKAGAE